MFSSCGTGSAPFVLEVHIGAAVEVNSRWICFHWPTPQWCTPAQPSDVVRPGRTSQAVPCPWCAGRRRIHDTPARSRASSRNITGPRQRTVDEALRLVGGPSSVAAAWRPRGLLRLRLRWRLPLLPACIARLAPSPQLPSLASLLIRRRCVVCSLRRLRWRTRLQLLQSRSLLCRAVRRGRRAGASWLGRGLNVARLRLHPRQRRHYVPRPRCHRPGQLLSLRLRLCLKQQSKAHALGQQVEQGSATARLAVRCAVAN